MRAIAAVRATRDLLGRETWRTILHLSIIGISAHSILIGLCLLSLPVWTLRLVGWEYSGSVFWPSQAGLFLIILGVAYGAGVWYPPLVWLLVGSKGAAVVFLAAHAVWLDAPRLAVLLGCVDGSMGAAMALCVWAVRTSGMGRSELGERPSD